MLIENEMVNDIVEKIIEATKSTGDLDDLEQSMYLEKVFDEIAIDKKERPFVLSWLRESDFFKICSRDSQTGLLVIWLNNKGRRRALEKMLNKK